MHHASEIHFTYLNGPDIDKLAMTDQEILDSIEGALLAQGRGQTVIEPRVHLMPDPAFRGHFNVLRGYVAPIDRRSGRSGFDETVGMKEDKLALWAVM